METGAIISISTVVGSGLTLLFTKLFSSKKEKAETLKTLMETEKLSQEAKTFIDKAVEERDKNINLKIKGFQKELLEAAETNYAIKKEMLIIKGKYDEVLVGQQQAEKVLKETKEELEKEQKVREQCVKRLDELEKQLNNKN